MITHEFHEINTYFEQGTVGGGQVKWLNKPIERVGQPKTRINSRATSFFIHLQAKRIFHHDVVACRVNSGKAGTEVKHQGH